jgi:hypothetical protein
MSSGTPDNGRSANLMHCYETSVNFQMSVAINVLLSYILAKYYFQSKLPPFTGGLSPNICSALFCYLKLILALNA